MKISSLEVNKMLMVCPSLICVQILVFSFLIKQWYQILCPSDKHIKDINKNNLFKQTNKQIFDLLTELCVFQKYSKNSESLNN